MRRDPHLRRRRRNEGRGKERGGKRHGGAGEQLAHSNSCGRETELDQQRSSPRYPAAAGGDAAVRPIRYLRLTESFR
ncbi:hypothetical protein GCM10022254_27890 [Actinomadura meridiana]|uniref:Uncharacterized protein n=1 Tax=Actinomadura meridiana TaxID=559626 RepID=A0ABP8C024_9ACTN